MWVPIEGEPGGVSPRIGQRVCATLLARSGLAAISRPGAQDQERKA